ncbi:G5 domain-containing protein [Oscillibacter sp.]|uniref:G5 and 3D domain-containing protein n=1 Tax=Oscillibacter sp. TaxID=1945593 RepID=UPI00262997B8|nr:G5 domain-containing protein [Oscillibacter sp.]MDD3347489.1 G5 domain-containing protein [Oscillibacter sp.]
MKHHHLRKNLHEFWKRRGMTVFATACILCVSIAATNWASALYILTGAEDSAIVLDGSGPVPDLSEQLVYVSSSSSGYDVTLSAGQTVTVRQEGASISVQSREETISALLDRLHLVPGPLDMVGVDLSGEGVVLTVSSDITYYDQVKETAAFASQRVANPELPQGTERVVQTGTNGIRTAVYEVVWSNGKQISRQFVEALDSTAVDEIVEYGTAVKEVVASDRIASVNKNADGSGTLVFGSGATLAFSGAKSMTATAYTAGYGGADTCTATGTSVRVGTVAVDKKVIPLGTRMYIVTNDGIVYGTAVAEDTGVRGNTVDLYYDTYQQCINFGRRSCTVYILE